jgi:Putative beta-barrel porin-2, OmpL-like. bbp2/Carboxypeptidase regulatory-like domain
MKIHDLLPRLSACAMLTGLLFPVVRAAEPSAPLAASPQTAYGAIVGIVTNSATLPVARATITAVRVDGSGIRATLSGSDGVYSFADLAPGTWSITAQVVGYPDVSVPLEVVASKATRYDLAMNASGAVAAPAIASAAPAQARPIQVRGQAPDSIWAQLSRGVILATTPTPIRVASADSATTTGSSAAAPVIPKVADALQLPDTPPAVDNDTPFAFGDFTWVNGSPRNHAPVFDTKFFTPDIRFDVHYMDDFNHPQDHTIVGSTESFRSGEFQLEQVSFGGDFHYENVRARFLSMLGLFATTTPRNDASAGVGQWDLDDAYRYLSEANAGYHFDVNHGLNVDAGIFVSYIGLFSYYNYDNWTYQPSYVSSNTPWFFNGMRIQWFPTNKLKIEPWIINGWQSYARFNGHLGFGGQILYTPNENLKLVFNNYGVGQDNLAYTYPGQPTNPLSRANRIHTDDSILYKYYSGPGIGGISKAAFSFTFDMGCEYGGGLTCTGGPNKENFIGAMAYNRVWFDHDVMALTLGGGFMNNPGRYLALLQPINGATAVSGTPYFTENPGQKLYQWDATLNFQYMPKEWITWWSEFGFRHSSVPYFSGTGGVTPPGGNNGSPQDYACNSGASSGTNSLAQATTACGGANNGVWFPDLRTRQAILSAGVMVKF